MVKLNELTDEKISQMSKEDLVEALKSVKTQAIKANKKVESLKWESGLSEEEAEKLAEQIAEKKAFMKENNLSEEEMKTLEELKWDKLSYKEALEVARLRDENFANQAKTNSATIDGKDWSQAPMSDKLTFEAYKALDPVQKEAYQARMEEKYGGLTFEVTTSETEDF